MSAGTSILITFYGDVSTATVEMFSARSVETDVITATAKEPNVFMSLLILLII